MKLQDLNDAQLTAYGQTALQAGKTNHALNAFNQLARKSPSVEVFRTLAEIYCRLERTAIEAIYLKAAIKVAAGPQPVLEQRLQACLEKFIASNPRVVEASRMLALPPYSRDILAQRKKFRAWASSGKINPAFELGLEQYRQKCVDPAIQNVWCSFAMRRGRHQEALTAAFLALVQDPADWVALTNISDILIQLRRPNHALDYAIAAVNLRSDSAVVWLNMGAVWELLGKTWESIAATQRAIELNPRDPGSWTNLGNAFKNSGRLLEALPAYRQALRLNPASLALWSNLLFGVNYDPQATSQQIADEHFEFGRFMEGKLSAISHRGRLRQPVPKRIRLGFVSADVRSHPVAYFLEPLWTHLDRQRFETFSYDNFPTEDLVTRRFKGFTDHWLNVSGMSDEDLVRKIQDDGIDILIDMSGHTARNRLGVFARKPAAVQITWLGHPNTTGLKRMDWRLTDAWCDPPGVDGLYSEKLWRLPIHAAYAPLVKTPEQRNAPEYAVRETPALKNGCITFGSCNNLAKLAPAVVRLWARILMSVPDSRLLIEAPGLHSPEYRQAIESRFAEAGIVPERLLLHNRVGTMQYKRYHEIDIALDPFPYGGGTTSCDLLWMGVPMVTLVGDRPMARIGSCFLNAVGHPEWIASSEDEYLAKAVALAADPQRLNMLRLGLRQQGERGALFDGAAYARSFEHAMEVMLHQAHGRTYQASADLKTYDQRLKQGNELMARRQWGEAFELFDRLRDQAGAEPNALFGAGLCSANLGDHPRAARFMADALLRRLEPQWVPWLAASYEKLGYSLPFYVLAVWLQRHHPSMPGASVLLPRAYKLMEAELAKRRLPFPTVATGHDPNAGRAENAEIIRLLRENRDAEALAAAEAALRTYPLVQALLLNASLAAKRLQQFQKSGIWCLVSFALDPLGFGAITNFGNLLVAANAPQDSMLLLEAGAIVTREDPLLWGNLAVAYNSMRVAPWEAEFAARYALKLKPDVATNWVALGKALRSQGRMAEGLEALGKAQQLDPSKQNNDLFTLQYSEELTPLQVAQAHFRAGREMQATCADQVQPSTNDSDTDRPLQLGFVSGDLVGHPVAYFMREVFEHLDQSRFPVTVYFTKAAHEEDNVTAYFRKQTKRWFNVKETTDDELAQMIRRDGIDILVDLSGHTAHNRLPVFARKPAPVQVTYLGHPNTTGLSHMDWRIVDRFSAPSSVESLYTEKLWRMPDAHCVYFPLVRSPEKQFSADYAVNQTPALANRYVTFGCCNNLAKISPGTVALWSRVLLAVPNARLLIEAPGLHQREFKRHLGARFAQHGIDPGRLILLNRDTQLQYRIYHQIDIALDPFPYNGGTTSCDLLWMGVPLLTLPGAVEVSRLGLSFVSTIGYPEWAAPDADSYVRIAADLASDVPRLNQVRQGLRARMEGSPLMDGRRFASHLQQAFASMWKFHVASTAAGHSVPEPHLSE